MESMELPIESVTHRSGLSHTYAKGELTQISILSRRYYGRYPCVKISDGPSHEFSSLSRFDSERLEDIVRIAISRRNKSNQPQSIIVSNRNTDKFSPNIKNKTLEKLNASRNKRMIKNKLCRNMIYSKRKEELEFCIKEKDRKLQLRLRKPEIKYIKQCWIGLFCVFGAAFGVKRAIEDRKTLKKHVQKMFGEICRMINCVGKIMIKLIKIRERKASLTFQRLMLTRIHRWLRLRKNAFRKRIANICERCITADTLFKSMVLYTNKIVRIQRKFKTLLVQRRQFYIKIAKKWTTLSNQIAKKANDNSKNRNVKTETISQENKIAVLRDHLKIAVREYVQNCAEAKKNNLELPVLQLDEIFNNKNLEIIIKRTQEGPPSPKASKSKKKAK